MRDCFGIRGLLMSFKAPAIHLPVAGGSKIRINEGPHERT
jgi:hypothetical protein